jgi:hypothetical protein
MPYIIVIEKNGNVKETNIKEYNQVDLYKKANFKSSDGFILHHKWNIEKNTIAIYGKINGKAGQENKYEFPPPIDNILFFGGCVLVSENPSDLTNIKDLRITEWNKIYENLMGGFEDLEDDADAEEEEEEEDKEPNEYICDDFVVEDDDVDYDDDVSIEEEEEEEEILPKKGKKGNKKENGNGAKSSKPSSFSFSSTFSSHSSLR